MSDAPNAEVTEEVEPKIETIADDTDAVSKRQRDESDPEGESAKKSKAEPNGESTADSPTKGPVNDIKPIEVITQTTTPTASVAPSISPAISNIINLPKTTNSASTIINSTLSPAGDSLIIEVMQDKVAQIIGSKGAVIQDMVRLQIFSYNI